MAREAGKLQLDAFRFAPLLTEKKDKSKPEFGKVCSIAFNGDTVYVGGSSGNVCVYQTEEKNGERTFSFVQKKQVGKKHVRQIELVRDLGCLMVLCDDTVTAHDPRTMTKIAARTANVKSGSMFCVERKSPFSLCVYKSRKLSLYQLKDGNYELWKELIVPGDVQAMSWQGRSICLAYKKEYTLIGVDYGDTTDIPVPVDGVTPCIEAVNDKELLLSSSAGVGVFINLKGEPVPKNPLPWLAPPIAVTVCSHFAVGLIPGNADKEKDEKKRREDCLQVMSLLDQKPVQTLPFKAGAFLSSDGTDRVIVASEREIGLLVQTSLKDQVQQYLNAGMVSEALNLMKKSNPTEQAMRDFRIEAGFVSLTELHFGYAFHHFHKSSADPREVLALFPDLHLRGMTYPRSHPRAPQSEIRQIIKAGQAAKRGSNHPKDKMLVAAKEEELLTRARYYLAEYLWRRRQEKSPVMSDPEVRLCVDSALLILAVELEEAMKKEGEAAAAAREGSGPASPESRAHRPSVAGPPEPTAPGLEPLEKLPFTIEQLLFPSNACHQEHSESFLLQRKRYNTLALVYQSKGQLRKALEVWSRLATGEFVEAQLPGTAAATGTEQKEEDIPGVRQTVALLSTLEDCPLLWEFSEWVLVRAPKEGMKIFTSPARDKPLLPDKVLEHLKGVKAANGQFDYAEAYLEHLIHVLQRTDVRYHNQLALAYLKRVEELRKEAPQKEEAKGAARRKLGEEGGEIGEARRKLYEFLRSSHYYNPSEVLQHALRGDLFEETIVLYSKLGQHAEVLKVYIFQLKDHVGAAKYCLDMALRSRRLAEKRRQQQLQLQQHGRSDEEALPRSQSTNLAALPISPRHAAAAAPSTSSLHVLAEGEEEEEEDYLMEADTAAAERKGIAVRGGGGAAADDAATATAGVPSAGSSPSPSPPLSPASPLLSVLAAAPQQQQAAAQQQWGDGDAFLALLALYFSDEYKERCEELEPEQQGKESREEKKERRRRGEGELEDFDEDEEEEEEEEEEKGGIGKEVAGVEPLWLRRAIAILDLYAEFIDPVKALKVIPGEVPIRYIKRFLDTVVPIMLHKKRNQQIVKHLTRAEQLRYRLKLNALKSVSFRRLPSSRCVVCQKAIGDAAIAILPLAAPPDTPPKQEGEVRAHIPAASKKILPSIPDYTVSHLSCARQFKGGPKPQQDQARPLPSSRLPTA